MDGYRSIDIEKDCPFDLNRTIASGQAPRWKKNGDWWYGVVKDSVIKTQQIENTLYFSGCSEKYYRDYFSLDYDLVEFYENFRDDPVIGIAIHENHGMRIIKQDPWECLCFQLTINKKRKIPERDCFTRISEGVGELIELDDHKFYTFPFPETIVSEGISKLKSCNLGYKAENIYLAAEKIVEDPLWAKKIECMDLTEAKLYLLEFKGIKPIVAEWILLFAFQHYECFPVDSHIRKLMTEKYFTDIHFPRKTDKNIDKLISEYARSKFGKFSAFALQYLFAARNTIRSM